MNNSTLDGLISAGVKKVSPGMVSTIMGFSRQTINAWIRAKKFPPEVFVKSLGKITFFDAVKLREWLVK